MILWEQAAKAFEVGLHTDNFVNQISQDQTSLLSYQLKGVVL